MIRLALFDWNETLLNDGEIWEAAQRKNFEKFGVSFPGRKAYFEALTQAHGDYQKAYESFGIYESRETLNALYEKAYIEAFQRAGASLAPQTIELLAGLRSRTIPCGIISTQSPEAFRAAFDRFPEIHGYFTYVRYHISEKWKAIQELSALEKIPASWTAYVGDTPSDMHHARRAHAIAIAIARDDTEAALEAARPGYLTTNLLDVLAIVDRENSSAR